MSKVLDGLVWRRGRSEVSSRPGCYMFVMSKRPVYIGMAKNLRNRIQGHYDTPWFRLICDRFGEPDLGWAEVEPESLRRVERELIRKYNPELNSEHVCQPKHRTRAMVVAPGYWELAKLLSEKDKAKRA